MLLKSSLEDPAGSLDAIKRRLKVMDNGCQLQEILLLSFLLFLKLDQIGEIFDHKYELRFALNVVALSSYLDILL